MGMLGRGCGRVLVVSRHQTTQQYGVILPIELTTAEIRNSKAYHEYHDCAMGEAAPKPKASAREKKGDSASSTTPPTPTPTTTVESAPRLSATAEGKQPLRATTHVEPTDVQRTEAEQLKLAAPKPKASARKKTSGSASSTTPPTPIATSTPTTTVVAAPRLSATAKGKKPARATTPTEPTDVERTKAEQLQIVLKRSRQETYISQQRGSGTDEGTVIMASLADKAILSGAENRPPLLEKDMYDSWRSRMEMYMLNRQHGKIILESVEHGPLLWHSVTKEGVTMLKKYSELSAAEAIQDDCDVKATNIILQALPLEIYAFVSTHKVAKDLWEQIQMLMQGTSLTKQERECKLYGAIDKFAYQKGETLRDFYLRFSLLLNEMNIYNMKLEQFQVNTKFLNTLPPE
nr:hypothetical protein [Tanacetum cinerariifolium]